MSKSQKTIKKMKGVDKEWLLALSLDWYATFYPKYYFLETTLKNRLYSLIKEKFGENWFDEQLKSPNVDTIFKVEAETILRRKPNGFILKNHGLLVESGLGMWVELFNRENYKNLKGVPILIFPQLPPGIKRKDLYQKLTRVKALRNQLVHYRIPPLTKPEQLEAILETNNDLVNLLEWLGISASRYNSRDFNKGLTAIKKALSYSA